MEEFCVPGTRPTAPLVAQVGEQPHTPSTLATCIVTDLPEDISPLWSRTPGALARLRARPRGPPPLLEVFGGAANPE
jgi:hypothetical protein